MSFYYFLKFLSPSFTRGRWAEYTSSPREDLRVTGCRVPPPSAPRALLQLPEKTQLSASTDRGPWFKFNSTAFFSAFGQGILRKVKICEKYTLKKKKRERNLFRKQFQSKCCMRSASGPLSRKAVLVTTQFSSIWRVGGFHFLPMGFFFISFFFFKNSFSFPTLVYCLVSIYPQGVWKPQVSIIGFFLVYFLIFLVWEHVVRICAFMCWRGWRAVCQSDDVHKGITKSVSWAF